MTMGHAKDNGGVWGHSSAIGANSYFIFAVGDQSLITEKAFMGWCAANAIGIKPLLGSYKGKTETSFALNYDHLGIILNCGWLVGQESILVLGACDSRDRRKASLQYLTNDGSDLKPCSDDLGVLQSVSRETALAQEAWSYDPQQKEYFICIDPNEVKICPIGLGAAINEHIAQHEKPMGYDQNTKALIKAYLLARRII